VREKSISFLQKTKTELAAAKSITVKEKERRTDPRVENATKGLAYSYYERLDRLFKKQKYVIPPQEIC
jgi:hypothetical protein